jgi:hypothetical protein
MVQDLRGLGKGRVVADGRDNVQTRGRVFLSRNMFGQVYLECKHFRSRLQCQFCYRIVDVMLMCLVC